MQRFWWTRFATPISKPRRGRTERKFLHIATLHNNPGRSNVDRTQNERNLRWALEDGSRLGRQPTRRLRNLGHCRRH